jgi:hypothetical protein
MLADLLKRGEALKAKNQERGLFCVIGSEPGCGKTSLAASLPNPVFLLAENGLASVSEAQQPAVLGTLAPFAKLAENGEPLGIVQQISEYCRLLATEEHNFKTLVIDTLSAMDAMVCEYVVAVAPNNKDGSRPTFEQAYGGYGKAYLEVGAVHAIICQKLLNLTKRGINVVLLSHIRSTVDRKPDGEDLTVYGLALTDGTKSHASECYFRNTDIMMALTRDFSKSECGKAQGGDNRMIKLQGAAYKFAKCRDSRVVPSSIPFMRNDQGIYLNPFNGIFNKLGDSNV